MLWDLSELFLVILGFTKACMDFEVTLSVLLSGLNFNTHLQISRMTYGIQM